MTFAEAVSRYGIDRPDTRFGLELQDLERGLAGSQFQVFSSVLSSGGVVRGINAGPRELPRSELDALTELAKQHGAKGLVWAFVQEDGSLRSPIAKFLSESEDRRPQAVPAGFARRSPADRRGSADTVGQALSALRMELARRFELIPAGRHDILWVVEFPAFFWDPETQRWDAAHHPFTAPTGDLDDPGTLSSRAYDLVLDGAEIGGGSIRIHDRKVQERVFELLGIGPEEAQARFGFLLDALRLGAPPHGGIAMGVDRIVSALAGAESIRDVIAFPKAASGADPLTGAPAPVDPAQLRELGLRPEPSPCRPQLSAPDGSCRGPDCRRCASMDSVSRPLIALLLGTVAVFALWLSRAQAKLLPRRRRPSSPGPSRRPSPRLTKPLPAPPRPAPRTEARCLHASPRGRSGRGDGRTPLRQARPAADRASGTASRHSRRRTPPATPAATPRAPAHLVNAVTRALRAHRTLALLFYNPAGADDRAVSKSSRRYPSTPAGWSSWRCRWPNWRATGGDQSGHGQRFADAGADRPQPSGQHAGRLRRPVRDRAARRRRARAP